MDHIIVPLDTSDVSARALEAATTLAASFDAEITLLIVLDTAVRNGLREAAASENVMIETEAASYLGAIAEDLRRAGRNVTTTVVDGLDPAAAISEASKAEGADLIVMCTHGRTGAERWLLGSVTDRVIRSSTVPVYVIPARD